MNIEWRILDCVEVASSHDTRLNEESKWGRVKREGGFIPAVRRPSLCSSGDGGYTYREEETSDVSLSHASSALIKHRRKGDGERGTHFRPYKPGKSAAASAKKKDVPARRKQKPLTTANCRKQGNTTSQAAARLA